MQEVKSMEASETVTLKGVRCRLTGSRLPEVPSVMI